MRAVRKFLIGLGVVLILSAQVGAVFAYFVYHTDAETNIMYDGFGRQLSQTPYVVRYIFGEERVWPGWAWGAVDFVVYWAMVVGGIGLCVFAERDTKPPPAHP